MSNNTLSDQAAENIIACTAEAVTTMNAFTQDIFHTRGGRIGSGMGSVIEGLWGFYVNQALKNRGITDYELGWIYGHEYNDFACILEREEWEPSTKQGEILRVEIKSMIASADESKAHFDRLEHEFDENEILGVFLWDWIQTDDRSTKSVYPAIIDQYVGYAVPVARLRDELHLDRGGSFVTSSNCPDGCNPDTCSHRGEPLNAAGVRERKSGPENSRGSKVSHAANFGGMLRMLGSRGKSGKLILKKHYKANPDAKKYLDFMSANFPRVAKSLL